MNLTYFSFVCLAAITLSACNHSKPKPVSNDISKTMVTVNGKKDNVINNPEKNYGNATVSEPCVKCLIGVIQTTGSYKKLTTSIMQQNIIYDVNWITSKKPIDIGNGKQIINGMQIAVNKKTSGKSNNITTYLYDNKKAQFYITNPSIKLINNAEVDTIVLKKIRNSCFWGVASSK